MKYPKGAITKAINRKDLNKAVVWVKNKKTKEEDTVNFALAENRKINITAMSPFGSMQDIHNDLHCMWHDPDNFEVAIWDEVTEASLSNQG